MPDDGSSIVYVLTNASMAGCVKIGHTTRSASLRSEELFTTGVPEPFEVGLAYRVPNGPAVERALHEAFRPYRVHERREFFRVEPYQVGAILRLLGTEASVEDVTEEVASDPSLIPNENIRSGRRPKADFVEIGVPIGSQIVCSANGAVATVVSTRKVQVDGGGEISLTAATAQVVPDRKFGNSYKVWTFNGKTLLDLYDQRYPNSLPPRENFIGTF